MQQSGPARILFVCLGNICRSPLAEGVMRAAAAGAGIPAEIDSAGTGDWHVGKAPDPRAIAIAARHGIDIAGLRARQVRPDDFSHYHRLIALDASVLRNLRQMAPAEGSAKLELLLDHAPDRRGDDVADPYFGDDAGFETALADIRLGIDGLLRALTKAQDQASG
jgi:protein-tyrosine phosphatase